MPTFLDETFFLVTFILFILTFIGMPEGAPVPDFPELPEQFAPGIDRDDYERILKRLKSKM